MNLMAILPHQSVSIMTGAFSFERKNRGRIVLIYKPVPEELRQWCLKGIPSKTGTTDHGTDNNQSYGYRFFMTGHCRPVAFVVPESVSDYQTNRSPTH